MTVSDPASTILGQGTQYNPPRPNVWAVSVSLVAVQYLQQPKNPEPKMPVPI